MKFLHTSDWHLGRTLYGKKRYEEFSSFLDWLSQTIESESIDALLVSGDVFDTSTPSNRAQALYYRFLHRVSMSRCRHIIVIAGNHDSPTFLSAPKELLKALNVHVVGLISDNLEDEIIILKNQNQVDAIICAVPYLRDKDIRTIEPGETIDDKNAKLVLGLKNHYAEVCELAQKKKAEFEDSNGSIPLIGMGHLFAAGGKTIDGDGVRELYVGSLAHVGTDVFPASLDYIALGHLHVPQIVGGQQHIRYSGSPIPMGYGEAKQQKLVITIEFQICTDKQDIINHQTKENNKSSNAIPVIREIPVPCFQPLVRIVGSLDHIIETINELKQLTSQAWLEIEYTGMSNIGNLREQLDDVIADTALEIRRIKNKRVMDRVIQGSLEETLDDLDVHDVFNRCLAAFEIPVEEHDALKESYNEIVKSLQEQDNNAE